MKTEIWDKIEKESERYLMPATFINGAKFLQSLLSDNGTESSNQREWREECLAAEEEIKSLQQQLKEAEKEIAELNNELREQ